MSQEVRLPGMFGADPINVFDPSPYGPMAYYGHLTLGGIAILAALVALWSIKGTTRHRISGYVFIASALIVCFTSVDMLVRAFQPPLVMAVFTAVYAIGGAWLALQKGTASVRIAEIGLTIFELVGLFIFLGISFAAVERGIVPPFAPYVIGAIPAILIVGDLHWFARYKDRIRLRIARHLNRMVWAFIVILRAPLVELAAGGLPLPPPFVIVGPIVLGLLMVAFFQRKYGTLRG